MSTTSDVELRVAAMQVVDGSETDPPKLVGHAIVFGALSEPLRGRRGQFRERITRRAVEKALARQPDVRALFNHNANKVIGRTKSGTLKMTIDDIGLLVEIDPPDTSVGRDAVTSVRRRDLDQMSFGMKTASIVDEWSEERIDGKLWAVRTITDFEMIDVSIVTAAAYPATNVAVRMLTEDKLAIHRRKLQLLEMTHAE